MPTHLRRIAIAGNSAVLVLLVLVLLHGPLLVDGTLPSNSVANSGYQTWCVSCSPGDVAERVLFIVVDGLRLDYAANSQLMPQLARLAAMGGTGTARIESLLPSTVAAIQTFVTGEVTPPVSFLQDFKARRAREGGIFAALSDRHWQTFVAGPRLWADLYGAWITTVVQTSESEDSRALRESLAALAQNTYRLLIVHFGHPDAAGHRYGVPSLAYASAVAWCDTAIGRLVARAGDHTAVLVASDHGVTAHGGHAGPEAIVRATPLVTWGPGLPQGALGTIRQRDIPDLVRHALGLTPMAPFRATPSQASNWLVVLIIAVVAVGCGIRLWAGLAAGSAGRIEATVLGAAPWLVLPLALGGAWRLALCLALLVLTLTAWRVSTRKTLGLLHIFGGGVLFGAIRLIDGLLASQCEPNSSMTWGIPAGVSGIALGVLLVWLRHIRQWHAQRATPRRHWSVASSLHPVTPLWLLVTSILAVVAYTVGGIALLVGYGLMLVLGRRLGTTLHTPRTAALYAGLTCAFLPVVLARLMGETVSLSTLDVRVAFHLLEGPGGAPAAVATVAMRHAMPAWGLLLGLSDALTHAPALAIGRFAAGLAAAAVGQALPAAWLLTIRGTDPVLGSLALGAFLRVFCEISYGFLGGTLSLWLTSKKSALSFPNTHIT